MNTHKASLYTLLMYIKRKLVYTTMRELNPEDIDYFIIDESAKGVPLEQIQYILEREYNIPLNTESLEFKQKQFSNKIRIQKEINERRQSKNTDELIVRMRTAINELDEVINRMKTKDEINADKLLIASIQQINSLINTLLKATGQLKTQQEANVSNYYIKITQINEFLEENMPSIFSNLSPEAKKRLKEQLREGISEQTT
jgi:hypothetical protein